MGSTRFDRELLPPAQTFYERELGKLSRPDRKGWSKARCPFHKSKSHTSLSVNVEVGMFFCHGCGAKGPDVLAFVRLRDHCDFETAAKKLGAWRDMSPAERQALDARRQRQEQERERQKQLEGERRRERLEARDQLRAVARLYEEAMDDHDWLGMSELLPRLRAAEDRYSRLAGLEAPYE